MTDRELTPEKGLALELAPTKDLIDELCRRFDALVLMGYQARTDDDYHVYRRYSGGPILTTGLVARCWMEIQMGALPVRWETDPPETANTGE